MPVRPFSMVGKSCTCPSRRSAKRRTVESEKTRWIRQLDIKFNLIDINFQKCKVRLGSVVLQHCESMLP